MHEAAPLSKFRSCADRSRRRYGAAHSPGKSVQSFLPFAASAPPWRAGLPYHDGSHAMHRSFANKALILFFRLALGWTFLYAGLSQLFNREFTAAGFLNATKTFHPFFIWFATPAMIPFTNFLVTWGHTLIGLSLLSGLLLRYGAVAGALLLGVYYFAHMDFPYVDGPVNFIMEYHLVYIGVLAYLVAVRAGEIWGIDGWLARRAAHKYENRSVPIPRTA